MSRAAARLGVVLVLAGAHASAPGAEPVRVPGTSVALEPPTGFTPAAAFPGFQQAATGASIMVTELPGAAAEFRRTGATKEALARGGLTLVSSTPVTLGGREALLLKVAQKVGGVPHSKWVLVEGDETLTALVVATFPASLASTLELPLRRAVLSSVWARSATADPFEGLPFRVEPGTRLARVQRVGNSLTLSGGALPLRPGDARFVVGGSIAEADLSRLRAFAERRAAATATLAELRNLSGRPIRVDGLEAWELQADARHAASGAPMRLYQVVVADGSSYFLLQGIVGAERADELLPEFRRITDSFRRVDATLPAASTGGAAAAAGGAATGAAAAPATSASKPAAAAWPPYWPELLNHTPYPATLVASSNPDARVFAMVMKMTLARGPGSEWRLADLQEPLMTAEQTAQPERVLGCPVEPATLVDAIQHKPLAEVFVKRLSRPVTSIALRAGDAVVEAPVEDGCVRFDAKSGPWRVPWLKDGDAVEIRPVGAEPVVLRTIRDLMPYALVRYEMGSITPAPARLDTLVISGTLDRAVLVWRASFPMDPAVRKVEFRAVDPDAVIERRPSPREFPTARQLERARLMRKVLRSCAPATANTGEPCSHADQARKIKDWAKALFG